MGDKNMSPLIKVLKPFLSEYKDLHFKGSKTDYESLLLTSRTLYIGNLSFYTSEEQIHELFCKVGYIEQIIIGLDINKKTPCGFCFVIYCNMDEVEYASKYLNG